MHCFMLFSYVLYILFYTHTVILWITASGVLLVFFCCIKHRCSRHWEWASTSPTIIAPKSFHVAEWLLLVISLDKSCAWYCCHRQTRKRKENLMRTARDVMPSYAFVFKIDRQPTEEFQKKLKEKNRQKRQSGNNLVNTQTICLV